MCRQALLVVGVELVETAKEAVLYLLQVVSLSPRQALATSRLDLLDGRLNSCSLAWELPDLYVLIGVGHLVFGCEFGQRLFARKAYGRKHAPRVCLSALFKDIHSPTFILGPASHTWGFCFVGSLNYCIIDMIKSNVLARLATIMAVITVTGSGIDSIAAPTGTCVCVCVAPHRFLCAFLDSSSLSDKLHATCVVWLRRLCVSLGAMFVCASLPRALPTLLCIFVWRALHVFGCSSTLSLSESCTGIAPAALRAAGSLKPTYIQTWPFTWSSLLSHR